jgi:peptide deformylase
VVAARKVRLYGDPILRVPCEPVVEIDEGTASVVEALRDTVDEAQGLGLAAPQIGISKRMIVVVEPGDNGTRQHHVVINPEIVSACGEDLNEEGCLSIPGIYAKVRRPESVVVQGLDQSGRSVNIEAKGLMARAFAHEIDHLDGILFTDRISMVKRSLLRRRLGEIKKQAREMLRSLQ